MHGVPRILPSSPSLLESDSTRMSLIVWGAKVDRKA